MTSTHATIIPGDKGLELSKTANHQYNIPLQSKVYYTVGELYLYPTLLC